MTLEKRIRELFLSLEKENVILGAKLLSSMDSLEKEKQIFLSYCNADLESGNCLSEVVLVPMRIYPSIRSTGYPSQNHWVKLVGENWEIFFVPNSRIYMMKRDFSSSIHANETIIL